MSSLAPLTTSNSCPGTFILSSLSGANPFALQGVRSSQRNVSRVQIAAPRTTPSISPATGRFLTVNLCSKNEQPEVEAIHCEDKKELPCNLDERNSKASKGFSLNGIMQRLKRYGVAGVLSYGLLNTVYYLTTFLLVWFYFSPAPGKMGYPAAVKRFLKMMAMVWAGSQVTKIIRAGGALALAPVVDRGLSWFTVKFNFESEGKAFAAIACVCFGLALSLFFGLTLLWA
ncbi:uncharacterized protein LOC122027985 isoform X1 [Zingiber officinale]|uniref:uncharacterized protein LOC122027985 isoform X1 n=1 Tax=Zingiber officinale TaxID=94328 RepID=UPI001C4D0932|nr:uncharacterized protein LOC122027985 isoform X1 [Zingiber officinale]